MPVSIHPGSFDSTLNGEETARDARSGVDANTLEQDGNLCDLHDRTNASSPDPNIEKGNDVHATDMYDPNRPRLSMRQRIRHFTWAWYTFPMSTGGLSMLFSAQLNQFPGLKYIGLAVDIINILIFTAITNTMVARFVLHTGSFTTSVTHPREGFFVPTFFLSLATLITSTDRYAVPRDNSNLVWAVQASYWAYVVVTLLLAIGQYSYVFAVHNFGLQTMMPTWILPIFPIMLSGTIASIIAETQPDIAAVPIILVGLTCQGLGLSVAVMMYAHMVGRLMQAGLPDREHRTGLFMCVGPPAFTALALIGMARGLPGDLDFTGDGRVINASLVRLIAIMGAVFLWALSLWWFGIAAMAVILAPPRHFHLGWWAMVFPNTGFTLATISIAREIGADVLAWISTGMSIIIVITFSFVLCHHVRAVVVQDIMYPGLDEDVDH